MRVIVLGAGVVGTAAAWYLGKDGHEVTVIDRQARAAEETSWGNAGLVSPGDATAWASPAALRAFLKSLYRRDTGLKVRFSTDPYFYVWCLKFLRQCTPARAAANTEVKLRLAFYSRDCLNALQQETGIGYDDRKRGILYFFRSQQTLDGGIAHMRFLAERGLQIEVLDQKGVVAAEPGLAAVADKIAGGIHSTSDQTGDSNLLARRLARLAAERHGVRFRFGETVTGLERDGQTIRAVLTSRGRHETDAVLVAMGAEAGQFLRPYGVDLPIYPVKGYSATLPLPDGLGPTMGGVDEDRLIAYSRLGNRLRLACTAEFAGFDRSHRPADFTALFRTAHELFPGAVDESRAELWAGLRPMMPGSVPVHGPTGIDKLYLDCGHGHVGWTMACGSGRLVADLIAGRRPEIDPRGLVYGG